MKKISFILFFLIVLSGHSQYKINWDVKQVSVLPWNAPGGVAYMQGPGVNLGVTSFQVIDEQRIALLSNASSEIVLVNRGDNRILNRLPVVFAPRDFVWDNGSFYVLSGKEVVVYNTEGSETGRYPFPERYMGTERLTRYNNATWLLLPSGNCYVLEADNETIKNKEFEGWITASGNFVAARMEGNNFTVKVIAPTGKTFQRTFPTRNKAAGAFVVGCTANRLTMDIQTFLSESPVSVERQIISIEITSDGIGDIINSRDALTCYYVLSNKDWEVKPDNTIYNMVTSPDGLYVFSLSETANGAVSDYPASLLKMRYHFNNHLIKVD